MVNEGSRPLHSPYCKPYSKQGSLARELALVLFDIRVSITNALDLFSILVGDLDIEIFFKTHYQFNQIKRICAEIFNKASIFGHFGLIDGEFIYNDLFDLILYF